MSDSNNPYQQPTAALVENHPDVAFGPVNDARRTSIGRGASWISEAWPIFTRNWGLWIAGIIVLVLISMSLGFIPVLGSLVSPIINPMLFAGVYVVAHKMDGGQPVEFGDFFAGFQNRPGVLAGFGAINLLLGVLFLVVIGLIGFGLFGSELTGIASAAESGAAPDVSPDSAVKLALFVLVALAIMIPYMALVWFALPLLVLDDSMKIGKALGLSLKGCLRNILPMFLFSLLGFVLMILGMIPFFLGLLVVMPLLAISMYVSVKDIYAPD